MVFGLGLIAESVYMGQRGMARSFDARFSDFEIFYKAAEAMVRGQELHTSGTGEYIYPPLIAWVLTPLTHYGQAWAMRVWCVVNLLATGISMLVLFKESARRLEVKPEPVLFVAVSCFTILANFSAIRWEFEFGQCDTLVLLGFALALRWMDRRPWLAGLALGLSFTIKYQSLVALPYLLVRRRFAAAASMLAGAAVFLVIPATTYGWDATMRSVQIAFAGFLNYVGLGPGVSAQNAAHVLPATFHRSFSVTSVAARLTDGVHHPGRMMLVTGLVAAIIAGIGLWMYRRWDFMLFKGRSAAADATIPLKGVVALEWTGLIVMALAFSPHTLSRHTYIIIPAHMLAFMILLRPRPGVNPVPLALGTIAFTLGVMLPPGHEFVGSALENWRAVGGTIWCMLIFFFTLVWTCFAYIREKSPAHAAVNPAR